MACVSRECLGLWKNDIYNRRYSKVVQEVGGIAMIFHRENRKDWIETFKDLSKFLDELSNRMIMDHVRKYLKDFLKLAIEMVKGNIGKTKLRNEMNKTLDLLRKAYTS